MPSDDYERHTRISQQVRRHDPAAPIEAMESIDDWHESCTDNGGFEGRQQEAHAKTVLIRHGSSGGSD